MRISRAEEAAIAAKGIAAARLNLKKLTDSQLASLFSAGTTGGDPRLVEGYDTVASLFSHHQSNRPPFLEGLFLEAFTQEVNSRIVRP